MTTDPFAPFQTRIDALRAPVVPLLRAVLPAVPDLDDLLRLRINKALDLRQQYTIGADLAEVVVRVWEAVREGRHDRDGDDMRVLRELDLVEHLFAAFDCVPDLLRLNWQGLEERGER